MIEVFYRDNKIILYPHDIDNQEWMIGNVSPFATFTKGAWEVDVAHVDRLNKTLGPIKEQLQIDNSFKQWRMGFSSKNETILIRCGIVNSKIIKMSKDAVIPHAELEKTCRYFFKGAINSDKYKSGKWDGYIQLYIRWEATFPTGLLKDVMATLTLKGLEFKVEHITEIAPPKQFNWVVNDGITPDIDQVEAVNAALEGHRGILKCPTGYGKTDVLSKRIIAAFGVPTLFVANKKSLLDDAALSFSTGMQGVTVGQIKDGWFGNTKLPSDKISDINTPVIVATIQSLSARLKDEKTSQQLKYWLNNVCKLIIVDESQALGTKTWDEVMAECRAPYRFGISATPRRTDGATIKLMAATGPILFTTSAEEQIAKGRLCDLDINYKVFDHNMYNESDTDVSYNDMYKACIMENEDRNVECIVKPALEMIQEGRHVLVLIQFIDHGHILRSLFIREGLNPDDVRFVWGDTPDKIRQSAMQEFKKGEFKVMIGSTIFDAGVNIPIISGVVLGGAGNSDITLIQRIGRGARNCDYEQILGYIPDFMNKSHGKKITKVYDVMDSNVKFFHKQSTNRYYNAATEFGKDRVHIVGGDLNSLRRKKKASSKVSKEVDQVFAQLEMIQSFIDRDGTKNGGNES